MSALVTRRRVLTGAAALATVAATPALATRVEKGADELLHRRQVEARLVHAFRELPPEERGAMLRMAQRIAAGMPIRQAGYRMCRELGMPPHEARERIDEAMRAGLEAVA